jgi:DNA modification methylase
MIKPYYENEHGKLYCGDCLEIMPQLIAEGVKVDAVVTDPPYGINANKMTLGNGKKKFARGDEWDIEKQDIEPLLSIGKFHCIWGGNYYTDVLPTSNDWLCWNKLKGTDLPFSEFELAWTDYGRNCRILSHNWAGEEKAHPTQKPLAVMQWCIKQLPADCETILDPFAGSGTTLVAAQSLGRKWIGIEISPEYCEIAKKRLEGTIKQIEGQVTLFDNGV